MPDHWHGVIEIKQHSTWSLGDIVQAVKAAATSHWRKINGLTEEPISATLIKHMSKHQRSEYYTQHPDALQPLFDDNYDDTICINEEHRQRMLKYVDDNPRRAIIRRLRPNFMQRRLHVVIGGRDYAAFGNLFLLRWARKVQVFCHRKAPDGRTPYEQTEAYRQECREWKRQVMEGATVIVTPGISKGELLIKNRCLESGYPLIHLQKEPIDEYWKPEASRFEACCQGSLLILAPWTPDQLGDVRGVPQTTDYSIFHNLNTLASEICHFDGEAKIVVS